mgnify:CR=1 FL=1
MKEIPLTQGKVAIVDDSDFERLSQFKWHAQKSGNTFYADRYNLYDKPRAIRMHREIMNAPKGTQVDHKNGNGLDNRKGNLRLATHQQNMFNQVKSRNDNKLGIKGVHWSKAKKKFVAQIKANGKKIHLGYFNVMGDADSAYRKAEEKYFGEFARAI